MPIKTEQQWKPELDTLFKDLQEADTDDWAYINLNMAKGFINCLLCLGQISVRKHAQLYKELELIGFETATRLEANKPK